MQYTINDIELYYIPDRHPRYVIIEGKGKLECFQFRVGLSKAVTRDELSSLVGHKINNREIIAVESFAVERQEGKNISLAFKLLKDPGTEEFHDE